jgi:DNA-binding CsgD family transcriptional regulator
MALLLGRGSRALWTGRRRLLLGDVMSKSGRLRLCDVRTVFTIIGECRDLGNDPELWHRRMLEGLAPLFGVVQAAGGEAWWDRPGQPVRPVSAYIATAEPMVHDAFRAYGQDKAWVDDPILLALKELPAKLITRTRRQLVPDTAWYASNSFRRYRKASRTDHQLVSVFRVSNDGATSMVVLTRRLGESDFSPRDRRLLNFFHGELGQLIGGPLVGATEPSIDRLSPRLRQTLACLLEGDSEKQVAVRLGLSHTTVHQYVTALYRHFSVQSRAQLLAHAMKRTRCSGLSFTTRSSQERPPRNCA